MSGPITQFTIEEMFTYQPPVGDQVQRYQRIRDAAKQLALVILDATPGGADQAAAIRKVREAVMTANAAIALERVTEGPTWPAE
jgi:hypothetical protein